VGVKRFLQFHLSTLLVASFATGIGMWAILKPVEGSGCETSLSNLRIIRQSCAKGFPLHWHEPFPTLIFDVPDPSQNPVNIDMHWGKQIIVLEKVFIIDYDSSGLNNTCLAIDIAFWLIVTMIVSALAERFARHSEMKKIKSGI
jgi:hypothetical protein